MKIFWTILFLCISNTFMFFAWYGHLKNLSHKPLIIAILVSWGIALFEYIFQVPGNRIGYSVMNLWQLKITQEVVTILVFIPFSIFVMNAEFKWDFIWAGFCILGAVYFIFR